jgi:VWFA-related protein
MRLAAWLMAVIALGHAGAQAPATPPSTPAPQASDSASVTTLRVTSRVVAISAVVRAKDGTALTNLTKDDFTLKQDGKDQSIRYFSKAEDLPLTFAVMVDVSNSQRTFIGDESLASDIFFRTVLGRPQDRAALLEFDAGVTQLRALTNDPNHLHLALSSLGLRPERRNATLLYEGVDSVARQILSKITGRKAMVILTDGEDVGSRITVDQAIESAQQNNVQIYSIYYSAAQNNGLRIQPRPGSGIRMENGLDILRKLSAATGGRVFTVAPGLSLQTIYGQIATDLRTQYELGYTPPADTAPNRFHKLELHVKEKGATVQSRNGFFAEP